MEVAAVLSGLSAVGGFMGYFRKGSVMSLIGGAVVAIGYGYAALLLSTPSDVEQGRVIAMASSGILGGVMAMRYLKTLKPVPLVLTILGIGAFTYFAVSEGK
jgi:uncharacterized membrane protein (UPF0136 family)